MRCEWKRVKLKDCCYFKEGYVNPPQTHPEYFDGDIKWIRAVDLNDSYVYTTSRTLSQIGFESAKKSAYLFPPDSIVISKSGTIGRLGIIKDYMCGNRATINIRPKENINLFYLFYFLRSKQRELANLAVGSVQKNLYISILEEIEIDLPSLQDQKRIAVILSSLDNKIELNNKINENLERQAQAIYQQWFSNIGKEQGMLSDICTYSKDRIAVSHLDVNTYFSTENMLAGKAGATEASSLPTTTQTTACHIGDTLISNIRPYFRKIVYCHEKCGCSTDVLCFVPARSEYSAYIYYTLYADKFFDFMVAGSKGTKMPRGDKQQIMTYPIILPSNEKLEAFNSLAFPILAQIQNNRIENKRISLLRDTLLPKLMNGEIDIDGN